MTPDFGPRATRPMARPGVMGVGCGGSCGGSCGNQSCAPGACHYPFENWQTGPESVPPGTQFIPPKMIQEEPSLQPLPINPRPPSSNNSSDQVIAVDVNASGQITATGQAGLTTGLSASPVMTKDQITRMMANASTRRQSPYSHIARR